MKTATVTTYRVRVFRDIGGWFWCDDALPHLDARGTAYATRKGAEQAAVRHFEQDNRPHRVVFAKAGRR